MSMALQMEDGTEGGALNVWPGCRQRMTQCGLGQQRVDNPLAMREGLPEAGEPLGVSSTRIALGGEVL